MRIKAKLPKGLQQKFEVLVSELSPENLCCDGELSNQQVVHKLEGIRVEWQQLERLAGRRVSESEIEQLWVDRTWRNQQAAAKRPPKGKHALKIG